MHSDRVADVDVRHVLRCDEDVLLTVGRVGGIDLQDRVLSAYVTNDPNEVSKMSSPSSSY